MKRETQHMPDAVSMPKKKSFSIVHIPSSSTLLPVTRSTVCADKQLFVGGVSEKKIIKK